MNASGESDLPRVSIVTPSFNQATYLEATIESVLAQSYGNIEFIIIDGGSTDGSVDIIRRYESQLAHWQSEHDEGQADAINRGFARATGEILAWLNSDDVYEPGAVEVVVRQFVENDSLVLLYGRGVLIDESGNVTGDFAECEPFNRHRLCNCGDYILQPTTFFRRNAFEAVGGLDESLHYCMDWDLWCKFAAKGEVHFEDRVLARARVHDEAKTSTGGRARLSEIREIHKRHGTTLWPHALCSYAAKECKLQAERSANPLGRVGWKVLRAICAVGGVVNFLHKRCR